MVAFIANFPVPGLDDELNNKIIQADILAENGGHNQTVVRIADGYQIFTDFQMIVRKSDVLEAIYSSDHGYQFNQAVA